MGPKHSGCLMLCPHMAKDKKHMQVREKEQIRQDEAAAHSHDEARVSHAKTSQLQLAELPPLGILTTKTLCGFRREFKL